MNKTTLGALLLFLVFGVLTYIKESRGVPNEPLKKDRVILAFGDSLTYGYGAPIDYSYPAEFEKKTGYHIINAGIPGEESAEGLKRLPQFLKQRPALVILCHGGNDILRKRSHEQLKNNLIKMVNLIKRSGAKVLLVGVPDFHVLGFKTLGLYKEVAKETGVMYEGKILSQIELHRELKSDYVHPNEKGYEMMADAFIEVLQDEGVLQK
ncbi:arylesterase [Sulfurimonas sp. HSL3-2]|uniref:arylesterase n=1 Tax=Hydrocurvibacter mobilis TaxID=3131936 RepID=UPI0031F97D79